LATPSPSLSSSSLSPLLRRWGGSPPAIGAWWHRRARGGVMAHAWSEEEVANRREGPLVGLFFVKGRDFLCPSRSEWIGSPSGFIDSFTAFPMLPFPLCCVWMVCWRPGIEDPVGLPPYWCRDGSAHRDIRRGVGPLERDLIATRLAVAIRLLHCASQSRQDCCRGAFLPGRNRAVAVPFPVAMLVVFRDSGFSVHGWLADDPLEGVCVPRACWACRVLQASSVAWFLLCCPAFSPGAWHLRACPVQRLSPFPGTPILGIPLRETRQSLVSLPLSALVPEARSGVRREATAWPGCGVACVVCSVAALSRPCSGVEAGARLASKACGLWVPLLAASGGGLVAVVVTAFSSRRFQVFLVARACTAVIARLCLVSVGVIGLALGRPVLLVVLALVFSQFRGPILGCQPVALSVVRQALVVDSVLVFPLALGAIVFGCGTLLRLVVLWLLMRRGGLSRSGCRGLKVQAGYSFSLSLLFFHFPSSPAVGGSPPAIGAWWRRWVRGGVMARAWREEEVANRREGPLVGSFFVKGWDFLCPSRSGWIGSPSGFIDSFTAFPMLPSSLCCVWMVCWRPGIEDPVGLPPCWCRDGLAHCEIRGGIGPLGCDLIATRLAVAIRLSGHASRS
ncbi:hypothetical protein Taro_015030, partial [Colocasia esculenta]|nr:hypothetical protein [Colocasia esculenta]